MNGILNFKNTYPDTTNTPGWTISCENGAWNKPLEGCTNWYCSKKEESIENGFIKTKLVGHARGRLDVGKCTKVGIVKVYLNNKEIAKVEIKITSFVVEFDFTHDNELKIEAEGHGVLIFNSFEIMGCSGQSNNEWTFIGSYFFYLWQNSNGKTHHPACLAKPIAKSCANSYSTCQGFLNAKTKKYFLGSVFGLQR